MSDPYGRGAYDGPDGDGYPGAGDGVSRMAGIWMVEAESSSHWPTETSARPPPNGTTCGVLPVASGGRGVGEGTRCGERAGGAEIAEDGDDGWGKAEARSAHGPITVSRRCARGRGRTAHGAGRSSRLRLHPGRRLWITARLYPRCSSGAVTGVGSDHAPACFIPLVVTPLKHD